MMSFRVSLTHLQFIDDTLLFGKANVQEAGKFKEILSNNEDALDHQMVNKSKYKIYLFDVPIARQKYHCKDP